MELSIAVINGNAETVKVLVEKSVGNARRDASLTAIQYGNLNVVKVAG